MQPVQMRSRHPWAFRRDEWAVITGVVWANDRLCYAVAWPIVVGDRKDFADVIPVVDSMAEYEFRPFVPPEAG